MNYKKLHIPTILAVSAMLLYGHTKKANDTDKKLEYITEFCQDIYNVDRKEEKQQEVIELQKKAINVLLLRQMDLGAKLDSCVIINE